MALPRMNFQRKIASLGQQSLSSLTDHQVQKGEYDHSQGTDLFERLQKVAYTALREYTYRKTVHNVKSKWEVPFLDWFSYRTIKH